MNWNDFISPNTGLLFYKLLYKQWVILDKLAIENGELKFKISDKGKSPFDDFYKIIYGADLEPIPQRGNIDPIELTTIYPGLLVGSGYSHYTKARGDASLGFYFDHTTGLPVIPGSSVKGVLRSAFEKANGNYVKELLKSILEEDKKEENNSMTSKEKMEKLWEPAKETGKALPRIVWHIFEGKGYIEKNGKNVWDYLPMHQRDVFLDAFPVKVKNKLLGNDYITPHKDKDGNYNPLKNPNPIQFLKVMPGVTFRFEFILRDFRDENGNTLITADNKRDLFKDILQDLGIGAKTNVGYGQFK